MRIAATLASTTWRVGIFWFQLIIPVACGAILEVFQVALERVQVVLVVLVLETYQRVSLFFLFYVFGDIFLIFSK
jgi:hypothetical protein